jgi:hypothetical protein
MLAAVFRGPVWRGAQAGVRKGHVTALRDSPLPLPGEARCGGLLNAVLDAQRSE